MATRMGVSVKLMAFLFCGLLAIGSSASAQISNPSSSPALTTSINDCSSTSARAFQEVAAISGAAGCGFMSTYKEVVMADKQIGAGANAVTSAPTDHLISFSVNNPGTWNARVTSRRKGRLVIRDEAGNCATYNLTPIVVAVSGALYSGGLETATTYNTSNCGDPDNGKDTFVDETSQGTLSGSGPTTVTMHFTWTATATSTNCCGAGGDEAVLRLGLSPNALPTGCTGIIDFSESPAADEGHTVTVTLDDKTLISPQVLMDGIPTMCGPIGGPCTLQASGQIEGCVGYSYNVTVRYYTGNTLVCSENVPTTNGSLHWSSTLVCPGNCNITNYVITATNKPGLISDAVTLEDLSSGKFGPIARGQVIQSGSCSQIQTPAHVFLSGNQENPPTGSLATGEGTLEINTVANTITYRIFHKVTSPTAAHIHGPAGRDKNAGVLVAFPSAVSPMEGVVTYSEGNEAALLSGRTYVNVHSATFPGGEIRGQVPASPGQVPSLRVWGMIALALLLMGVGSVLVLRRRPVLD